MTKATKPMGDFFNWGALQVLGALEDKTPEEEAISLLEQEKELRDNKQKETEEQE